MGYARTPNWPDADSIKIPKIEDIHEFKDLMHVKFDLFSNLKIFVNALRIDNWL